MSTKNLFRLSVLMLLMATVSSCSKIAGEYTSVIPSDAVVVSFHLQSLADKAGIQGDDAEQIRETLLSALTGSINASSMAQMEKIIRNPSESGIAVDEPFYLFTAPSINDDAAVTARVSNLKNLRSTLETLATEGVATPVNSQSGYEYTVVSRSLFIAFNENTALMFAKSPGAGTESSLQLATRLISQSTDKSIRETKGFEKMTARKGEITFWLPFASVSNADMLKSTTMGIPEGVDMENVSLIGGLSFEKGKTVLEMETYTEDKKTKALLDNRSKGFGSIANTYLKNLPASTLAFITLAIQGEEIKKMMLESEDLRGVVPMDAIQEIAPLLDSFKGDVTIALTGVSLDRRFNPSPSVVMLAEIKDKESVKELHRLIEEESGLGIKKRAEGEYVLSYGTDIYLGQREKTFYVTTDLSLLANLEKGLDKNMKESSYASHAKGKSTYAVLDIKAVLDMPLVKLAAGMGGEEAQTYYQLGSLFEYVEMYMEKDGSGVISLQMANKETNALKQVVDFARGFAGL